jgi:hypothetical protein
MTDLRVGHRAEATVREEREERGVSGNYKSGSARPTFGSDRMQPTFLRTLDAGTDEPDYYQKSSLARL